MTSQFGYTRPRPACYRDTPDRQLLGTGPWRPPTDWILGGRGRFMSCWGLPRRPSPIFVRPAAARARRGLPLLPPPTAALARRAAPRPHGRLQVGRSWRSLSDLELSKEPDIAYGALSCKLASERVPLVRVSKIISSPRLTD